MNLNEECYIFIKADDRNNAWASFFLTTKYRYQIVFVTRNKSGKLESYYQPSLEVYSMGNQPGFVTDTTLTESIKDFRIDRYYTQYHKDGVSMIPPTRIILEADTMYVDNLYRRIQNCKVYYEFTDLKVDNAKGVVNISSWNDLKVLATDKGRSPLTTIKFLSKLEEVKSPNEKFMNYIDFIYQLRSNSQIDTKAETM